MLHITYLLLLLVLSVVIFQDFRLRAIHWILIPSLLFLCIYKSRAIAGTEQMQSAFGQNSLFIIVQLVILIFYFSFRTKKIEPVINSYLGLGDVLFLIAIAPSFCFGNFLLFIVGGFTLILIAYGLFSILKIKTQRQIPLAGIQSVFLSFWLGCEWLFFPKLSFTYLPLYFAY